MVEEETPEAAENPSKVIHNIGQYVKDKLLPIVNK